VPLQDDTEEDEGNDSEDEDSSGMDRGRPKRKRPARTAASRKKAASTGDGVVKSNSNALAMLAGAAATKPNPAAVAAQAAAMQNIEGMWQMQMPIGGGVPSSVDMSKMMEQQQQYVAGSAFEVRARVPALGSTGRGFRCSKGKAAEGGSSCRRRPVCLPVCSAVVGTQHAHHLACISYITPSATCVLHWSPQGVTDERELKKLRRKQSNRDSARRSRLRKQAECEQLAIQLKEMTAGARHAAVPSRWLLLLWLSLRCCSRLCFRCPPQALLFQPSQLVVGQGQFFFAQPGRLRRPGPCSRLGQFTAASLPLLSCLCQAD
jgi:hypothetical protein